jgi:hypothetical protein
MSMDVRVLESGIVWMPEFVGSLLIKCQNQNTGIHGIPGILEFLSGFHSKTRFSTQENMENLKNALKSSLNFTTDICTDRTVTSERAMLKTHGPKHKPTHCRAKMSNKR